MKLTVSKSFTFEAAHSLPHMPEGHKCRRTHGHTWTVTLYVSGPVDPSTGFVIDYAEIKNAFERDIFAALDHQNLNDVICPSTNENLVQWIVENIELPGLVAVECQEGTGGKLRIDLLGVSNMEPKTPSSIIPNEPDYNPDAWKQYTLGELGQWVHLLVKRAGHRADAVKREKDLADAQAYLDMMQSYIDAAK